MDFVIFKKGEQKNFLTKVKENSKLSWDEIASMIGRNRSMIFFYLREESKMPLHIAKFLSTKYFIKIKDYKTISINNIPHKIKIPKISAELSEFLGALSGDGCIGRHPSCITITSHKILDKKYTHHLFRLFTKLFGCKPKIITQDNVLRIIFYSKELSMYLNKKYNFPIGKKKGKLHIPKPIKNNKKYLIYYIRGLFDTDGSISRHHKSGGAILEISSADKKFLNELNKSMKILGFKAKLGRKNITIYAKKEIDRFFKQIKPANKKHLTKYENFKRTGKVLLTQDLMRRWSNGYEFPVSKH